MLHLRIVSPARRTDAVLAVLRDDPAAFNLSVLPGAGLDPVGDLILCDVAREGANGVVSTLRELGVHHHGTMALDHVEVALGDAASEAERRSPGHPGDAAVWEEVEARVHHESALTASFVVFIVVAALIAAVGLVQDAPILIVGAMVVGPEFGPVAGLSVGLFTRSTELVRTALATLTAGLVVATAAAYGATWLADAAGLVPDEFSPSVQPLTGFIVDPSVLSFVVAFLAGVTGTLSLTEARSGALIGVLISVTTIPAVSAIGVAGALHHGDDAAGAAVQLGLNITALLLAGVLTLWVQRTAWSRFADRRRREGAPGGGGRSGRSLQSLD
jgi:uncharacterized hydrophobic protein (TIGR00271 family)